MFVSSALGSGQIHLGSLLQQRILHVDMANVGKRLKGVEVIVPLPTWSGEGGRVNNISQGCVGVGAEGARPGHIQKLGISPGAQIYETESPPQLPKSHVIWLHKRGHGVECWNPNLYQIDHTKLKFLQFLIRLRLFYRSVSITSVGRRVNNLIGHSQIYTTDHILHLPL